MPGLPAAVKAAADAADDVDRRSRFPFEAIDLLEDARLLSCSLPIDLGGRSYGIAELAVIARALSGACSLAGMVFAMHHSQALSLAHDAHEGQIARLTSRIAADESLLASATTEITTGGDVRSSTSAVISDGDQVVPEKNAAVVSAKPRALITQQQAARPVAVDHQRGVAAPDVDRARSVY
jgi:acyl-CoA dehydrogenase